MNDLQKYKELCESQAREIENYARIMNGLKYILAGAGAAGVYDHINHRIFPPETFMTSQRRLVGLGGHNTTGYLMAEGTIKDTKKMKQCLSCGGKCGGDKQTGCMFYANVARETIEREQKWRKEEMVRKGCEGKNLQQELDAAKARCLKLEGVIEYLEKQAKK